jgi:3'-phosphoadenosine 5'-phosphosulfate sulfotransferase (PAPS reductase)/FAD synthetase
MSGGRDSTYVLYLAKKLLGLKVLAVNYDNEFRNDQAVANMKRACDILNVNLVSIRSKRNIATKMVKHNMLCSDLTRVLGVCRACTYGYRSIVYSNAVEHKVPLILWGDSQLESTKKLEQKAKQMARQKQTRTPRFFSSDFYKYEYFFLLQRMEFPMPGKILPTRSTTLKRKDVRQISVFDYIHWNRMTIKETITKELGWEKPAGSVSTWRTDCRLGAVVNYCFLKVYGCTKNCFGFCSMVRAGQMDREEALREEEQMLAIVHKGEELQRLLRDRIGLSEKEIAKVLSL